MALEKLKSVFNNIQSMDKTDLSTFPTEYDNYFKKTDLSTFPTEYDEDFNKTDLSKFKSLFSEGVGQDAPQISGRFGTDFQPKSHSALDDFIGMSPTPDKKIPDGIADDPPQISGRHDSYLSSDSELDLNGQPINFNPPGIVTLLGTTETNESPPFPTTYRSLNQIIDGEFQKSLGDQLRRHTWTDLYNKDHTSKRVDITNPRSNNPFQPFSYGNPNISSELNIRKTEDGIFGFAGSSRTSVLSGVGKLLNTINFLDIGLVGNLGNFLQDTGKEPYIVSNLPTTDDFEFNGRLINAGSRLAPPARAVTDAIRISKYLTSPAGILALASKNSHLLVASNVVRKNKNTGLIKVPQRFNSGYNPTSILNGVGSRLLGQAVPNYLMKSGWTGGYGESSTTVFDILNAELMRGYIPSKADYLINTFTGATHDVDNNPILQPDSDFSFFGLNNDVKKTSTGDKMTLAPMIKGHKLDSRIDTTSTLDKKGHLTSHQNVLSDLNIEDEKNGMPFYFKDLRDDTYIFFRAFLEGITEDITPTWTEHNYIGRSESVWTYERGMRVLTFSLKLYAQSPKELKAIYKKMNRLTSLCYPEYAKDEYLSDFIGVKNNQGDIVKAASKSRMKPPLTKFRMGELFGNRNNEMMGFIEALNVMIPDGQATWETRQGQRVPKHITATITYHIIHGEVPGLYTENGDEYEFYGYPSTGVTVKTEEEEDAEITWQNNVISNEFANAPYSGPGGGGIPIPSSQLPQ